MNVNFEKAKMYIDRGSYTKAVDSLYDAIEETSKAGNENEATQYKCVLGELFAQLEMEKQATAVFREVVEYSDTNRCLYEQRAIAQRYLIAYETNTIEAVLNEQAGPAPAAKSAAKEPARPGYVPLVPKPTQDKSFITKQMSKKRR